MGRTIRSVVEGAIADFRSAWYTLAVADVVYTAITVALLVPGISLLLRWLRSDTSFRVAADVDIARFLLTTRIGVVTILIGGSLLLAVSVFRTACLIAIGLAAANGVQLPARTALAFAATQAHQILRLAGNMFVRILIGIVPFALAGGAVYFTLLRSHDINYYLARRPPEFVTAAVLAGLIGLLLLVVVAWTIARWAFALPLMLFEGVSPRGALGESAARSRGHRATIVVVIAAWAVVVATLLYSTRWVVEALGRGVAPWFAGSLPLLLAFTALLAALWAALGLLAEIVNDSLLALLLARLYVHAGAPREPRVPQAAGKVWHLRDLIRESPKVTAAGAALFVLALTGVALLAFQRGRINQDVMVIAHRGASVDAPENTLAAFRLAGEQKADFVEFDVQESADGVVVVVHDSDLMKIGGSPLKVWETDAAELRAVDIGSHTGPQFAGERVATLAEALEACKGNSRVIVELKSYGHDQHLEERVAAIVEAAGMEKDCIFMSLDRYMVEKMKRLRPQWRTGLLVAKAIGDLGALPGDFLAVEARMATGRFVRRAHSNGQQVYVWTVNDPAWMLSEMSRGVDGLITDRPALARRVVERRAAASDAQRILAALLVRLDARTETLEREDALRP